MRVCSLLPYSIRNDPLLWPSPSLLSLRRRLREGRLTVTDRIAQIRARLDAATPGRWFATSPDPQYPSSPYYVIDTEPSRQVALIESRDPWDDPVVEEQARGDVEMITHTPDCPWLALQSALSALDGAEG